MNVLTVLEIIAAAGAGLTAGIFYAFSTFVMAAFARLPAEQGIAAMNSINVTVFNPWFMTVFMGTPVLCAIIAVMALFRWGEPGTLIVIAACLIYIVGSFVVTMLFNVPLNNELVAANGTSSEGAAVWARYLTDWTWWNSVRTALPLLAMVLFIIGLIQQSSTLPSSS